MKVWTLLLRWDLSSRSDFIMEVTAKEYLPVMSNGCLQQTATCSSSSCSSGEPDNCHLFKVKAWIFKSAAAFVIQVYMSLFPVIQWPTSNSINGALHIFSRPRAIIPKSSFFFNCAPCCLLLSVLFILLFCDKTRSDPRRYDGWALMELSVFAPVQDEDQRWDGPEEAHPVSGGVDGAPREDEASSTGWVRELSSEDGGHAALHGGSGARSRVYTNRQITPAAPDHQC